MCTSELCIQARKLLSDAEKEATSLEHLTTDLSIGWIDSALLQDCLLR